MEQGALDGTAKGAVRAHRTGWDGQGGSGAVGGVDGKLKGLHGTFARQHSGVMVRGKQQLSVTVVADSGTGELVGLSGTLDIMIAADGTHSYELKYSLG